MIKQNLSSIELWLFASRPSDQTTSIQLLTLKIWQDSTVIRASMTKQNLSSSGNSQNTYAVEVLGPVTSSSSWQSRAAQGFDHTGFPIDWQAKKAICPQGKSSRKWTLKQDRTVSGVIRIQFGKQDCLACPCRSQCTTAITNPPNLSCVHKRNLRPFKRRATANRPG